MANISDIAKQAGVSKSTVSRVLNGHKHVSKEKRRIILDVMERLEYSPNGNAINLSRGKTNTIGVLVPRVGHPFFHQLIEGIGQVCMERNHTLLVIQTEHDPAKEEASVQYLRDKRIDGLIIGAISQPQLLKTMRTLGPVVACEDHQGSVPSISFNHGKAMTMLLQHVEERGATTVGLCLGNPDSGVGRVRRKTFDQYLKASTLHHEIQWYADRCYSFEDGQALAGQLLTIDLPDAIIVGNDEVAVGLIHQFRKDGIRVPEDIAITGFDDVPIARALGLTTIRQPVAGLGRLAAERLWNDELKNNSNKSALLEPSLMIRETT
ncbi:LacI family DNA-binding transcriptional regulator [Exiguobacterium sp. TBG-PICH-001]|uniref:LacI family DNA-binding transcriptional regulator n=1 Tax=Exiguobacterium abrahamii TaxID=2785532 RepID=UPI0018A7B5AA|nr:LacI family DNA-binding transcriptional regulator [Exiguobacterium sp. TBG-PICH-001]MBF8153222.1 LacI family DNA-binding transcriptional regulator [Exiguobacterium sp. TBG-PICH-001]